MTYSDPNVAHKERAPIADRFFAKVDIPADPDGCWVWTGTRASTGYGQIWAEYRMFPAHRIGYELLVGEIPVGLQLDHLCRNRICVNPEHLEPVTCQENLLRGETHAAANAAKTICIRGHNDWEPRVGRAGRRCATCKRENSKRLRERGRAW